MKFVENPNITHGTIAVSRVLCSLQSRGQIKASYYCQAGIWNFSGRVLSVFKKLCYIALYHVINIPGKHLSALTHYGSSATGICNLSQSRSGSYSDLIMLKMHMILQPSNVSRTALILLSFIIMCHWNVLAFALSERNLGLTSFWRVVTM